jgi:hypothetical protein
MGTFPIAMDDEGVPSMKSASTVRARLWFGVELSDSLGHIGCLLQHIGNLGSSIIFRQSETTNCLPSGRIKSPSALLPLLLLVCGRFDVATFLQRPITDNRGGMFK